MSSIDDPIRLLTLKNSALLDSGREASFDRYTRLASQLLNAPVSLMSLVDRERQYFKSSFGLGEPWVSQCETPLSHSFCKHVVLLREPLVIDDARQHPLVLNNPAIVELGVVAYLGIPLSTPGGQVLGSFCVIDDAPRKWSEREVGIMQDIAAAVMTEIDLRNVSRAALAQLREMQSLASHRDEMVHMLVHDLRTPLSSLMISLEAIRLSSPAAEPHRPDLERATRGSRVLMEMISEILTVNRDEATHLIVGSDEIDPGRLVAGAVDQVMSLALSGGILLESHVPDLPAFRGDAEKLQRVLINLLANAIANTPPAGSVVVSMDHSDGVVSCSVADSGVGVAEEDQERIFLKYQQVTANRRRGIDSSGLGLPFCRSVIESHGGRIWIESAPEQGATFRFTIPTTASR